MTTTLAALQEALYATAFGLPSAKAVDDTTQQTAATLIEQLSAVQRGQYQWMIYANHAGTLETIYPYCHKLLQPQWRELVKNYLHQHPPRHYQLYGAALAFPDFLSEQKAWVNCWPFLEDLARYELLEATILRWPDTSYPPTRLNSFTPLHQRYPIINQAAQPYTTVYPLLSLVSMLQQEPVEEEAFKALSLQPLTLWVYRDVKHQCRFFQISSLILAFLTACLAMDESEPTVYQTLIEQVCASQGLIPTDELMGQFIILFEKLETLGILVGSHTVQ